MKSVHRIARLAAAALVLLFVPLIGGCADDGGADGVLPSVDSAPTATTDTPSVAPTPAANSTQSAAVAPTAVASIALPTETPRATPTNASASPTPAAKPTHSAATALPTATSAPMPAEEPPQTDAGNIDRYGGTLNLVSRSGIRHQDVHLDVSAALAAWGPGIAYSRLMRFKSGADVALPSLAVECELCADWTMVDDTTFEFKLRDDVAWQNLPPVNGRRLVASDIAFSYARQREEGAPNAPLLHIIDAVEAPSGDTLRIGIQAADADFMSALADGRSKVVAREAVALNGELRAGPTIGSGAWILVETQSDAVHIFERNADYFERDAPYVDRLRIQVIADAGTAYAAFRVGGVDVHRLQPGEWADFREQQPGASMLEYEEIGTGLEVAFNATAPPFDDVRVRQAAMLATRPWDAIADIWQGAARLSQGMPLARADWRLPDAEMRGYFGHPARAIRLLADAGAALPLDVVISVGDFDAPYLLHAERIADEMRAVGFAPQLDVVNRRRFGEEVWFGGEYEMFAGPTAPVSSPNGYMLAALSGKGTWNTTGHRDAALDALIEAQAQEYDGDLRAKLAREAQRLALQNGYRHMPAAAVSLWAWWPRVQGFHPNFAGLEYSHWARVWLQK